MNLKQITTSTAIAAFIALYSCSQNKEENSIIVNVPQIANKTPDEVIQILGKPDSVFTQYVVRTPIFTHLYNTKHLVEVQYPKGKATDIVVRKPVPMPYDKTTLQAFGIEPKDPTYVIDKAVMRWKNIPQFSMISFYVVHTDENGAIDDYRIYFKPKETQ